MGQPGKRLAIFVATSGHSGVDRVVKNLLGEFAERGLDVDLLRICGHGPYLESVPTGVRLIQLKASHAVSSLPELVRYLRQERPFALLSDKDRVNRVALLAHSMARVPTRVGVRVGSTVSVKMASRSWLERRLQYWSMRRLYPRASAIIVPSRGAAQDLARIARLPEGRIQVLPSPVVRPDLPQLAAAAVDHPWFADDDLPVILGVGELSTRKDFATLLKAFAKIARHRPCRLVILGEGRQRESLLLLARELEIAQKVSLPGFVANPFAYLSKASLFVLSSTCEGSPVALMEALGVGVPVVSTDCPSGPREILMQGRYGRLVPVGDADALAEAMLATLTDPPDRAFLQNAAQPYTVQASAEKYLEALLGSLVT